MKIFSINTVCFLIAPMGIYQIHSRYLIMTYLTVVPTTHLLINNQESYNVVHVEMLATLSAVCSSFGARPVDELSWLINDVPANQLIANSTTRSLSSPTNEYTYDSVSFLTFRPKDKTGSVVCLSKSGVAGRERSVKAHYVTYGEDVCIFARQRCKFSY